MSKRSKPTPPGRGRKDLNALNAKVEHLAPALADGVDRVLTTNQGLPVNDDQNSLKAGERGGTLLEDFILREKITHFDRGREPENFQPARAKQMPPSPALSMANTPKDSIKSRKIAALVADGFDGAALAAVTKALTAGGAQVRIIAPHLGTVRGGRRQRDAGRPQPPDRGVGAVRCGLCRGRSGRG